MKIEVELDGEPVVHLEVEMEDTPIRGNVLASGDDAVDRREEDRVINELNSGNVWAWAFVRVIVQWGGFTGQDGLGGCSYESEEAFKACPYYADMVAQATKDLKQKIAQKAGAILNVVL